MKSNITPNTMRAEVPNPAFERRRWRTLNGPWQFAFDNDNQFEGMDASSRNFHREIQVPFCYQSELSGIGTGETCENVWYKRSFQLNDEESSGTVLLHFGAVDYIAKVWVNDRYLGCHEGGFTPFCFDISCAVQTGENQIVVKAEDSYSKEYPRGKQMWGEEPDLCWYANTTGIWQSVWLEFTGENYITRVRITPDLDKNQAHFEIATHRKRALTIRAVLSKEGQYLGEASVSPANIKCTMDFTFNESGVRSIFDLYWSPDFPALIDVELILTEDGREQDRVYTYFGMRKIHKEGDKLFLNNQLLYQRLVLDQGYWPDSLMTPPSDEAIRQDILLTKSMGFNGARKHQKIEDPRYYYWADKLGLLVWGELPSSYDFTYESRGRMVTQMCEFIDRDYNHPCIIHWVPLNESWGVYQVADNTQQQDFVRAMYYIIKANDPARTVSSNDGWEQIEINDICGIHDYDITPDNAEERYQNLSAVLESSVNCKPVYARGIPYTGVPVMLTEMGGVKLKDDGGWGYSQDAENAENMLDRLSRIMDMVRKHRDIRGFCYTQLTDVMQETNGLLDARREPKIPLEQLRKIFG